MMVMRKDTEDSWSTVSGHSFSPPMQRLAQHQGDTGEAQTHFIASINRNSASQQPQHSRGSARQALRIGVDPATGKATTSIRTQPVIAPVAMTQPSTMMAFEIDPAARLKEGARINTSKQSELNQSLNSSGSGMEWFNKNTRAHRDQKQGVVDLVYHGASMDSDVTPARSKISPFRPRDGIIRDLRNPSEVPLTNPTAMQRIASWLTNKSSSQHEEDSLHDFDESEWTPADSSYGAAIPVAGWIPKSIRRMIEYSLIVLGVLMFVYLLVATSMRITEDAKASSHNKVDADHGGVNLDDDRYIQYGDDGTAYKNYNITYYNNNDDNSYGDDGYNNRRRNYLRELDALDVNMDDDYR